MRPYLMSDGGNVRVVEIDGPVVRLELQGACGSCPRTGILVVVLLLRAAPYNATLSAVCSSAVRHRPACLRDAV
eukprot:13105-Heterococcus_DN1.PRE.1